MERVVNATFFRTVRTGTPVTRDFVSALIVIGRGVRVAMLVAFLPASVGEHRV